MQATQSVFGPADLTKLRDQHPEARVIDVRTPGEFASGHIPGSYNVPLPDLGEHRDEITAGAAGPVVLVCRSGRRAEAARERLDAAGLVDVQVLAGGVDGWHAAGAPLERVHGATTWSIERQVRGVAGAIVASAIVTSLWWSPARFVAGAIGAGLLFAALTDTCAMGSALARLPYNRRRDTSCDLPSLVSTLTEPVENRTDVMTGGESR